MNKNRIINTLVIVLGLVLMTNVEASTPLWTFAPITSPSVSVMTRGTGTVQYTVTNQSHKSHTLQMEPIQGITPSGCTNALDYHQSCTLNLSINGPALTGDIQGGPVLCDHGNPLQCYQPSQANSLAIHLIPTPTYTITPSAGPNGTTTPNTPQVVYFGDNLTVTALPITNYGVNQWFVDGNLVQTGGPTYQLNNITANHTINVTFGTVTLTPSVSKLGLSVNCLPSSSCLTAQNASLTGNSRQITIHNSGTVNATHVTVSAPTLPSGTSFTTTCNGTLNAGSSCIITITPGAVVSQNCTTGTNPTGSAITISADEGLSSQVTAFVLSYGCQYQGGYVYSIDDTTPNTGSIGGKVAALTDSVPGQTSLSSGTPNWGGSGCTLGIPQSNLDGSTNSATIVKDLTTDYSLPPCNLGSPVPISDYAAGTCSLYSTTEDAGLTWYLPSMCELAGDTVYTPCGGLTNMLDQLWSLVPAVGGFVNAGHYWASNEYDSYPSDYAISMTLSQPTAVDNYAKYLKNGIRCSRALTP